MFEEEFTTSGTIWDWAYEKKTITKPIKLIELFSGVGEKKSNGGSQYYEQIRIYATNIATAIAANSAFHPNYKTGLRIRKLTPCECIKLMGFEQKDYRALVDSNLSDSAIYHMAGDSIVTTVLTALFSKMTDADYKALISDYTKRITNNK